MLIFLNYLKLKLHIDRFFMMSQIFTVSEYNEYLNESLAEQTAVIEGEVSEFKVSQNKWLFFNLKDSDGILKCFATVFQIKNPVLEDGLTVRIYGYPKIHGKSGNFSFTVLKVEPVGEGALKRAYEILKQRLENEGLFALERKRVLPKFPESIGLITSGDSAAYSDFVKVLKARWGGIKIYLINTAVQGQEAVSQITTAFEYFNRSKLDLDLVVLIRGGGSMEDLQAFNSEEIARAIFGSRFPVAVGVGHEKDETLADFAADLRCSTPSNVAELIAPQREEISAALRDIERRLMSGQRFWIEEKNENVEDFMNRLSSIIEDKMMEFSQILNHFFHQIEIWRKNIVQKKIIISNLIFLIETSFKKYFQEMNHSLMLAEKIVSTLNPQSLLKRGYAIAFKDGRIIKNSSDLEADDEVKVRLFRGGFSAKVLKKDADL